MTVFQLRDFYQNLKTQMHLKLRVLVALFQQEGVAEVEVASEEQEEVSEEVAEAVLVASEVDAADLAVEEEVLEAVAVEAAVLEEVFKEIEAQQNKKRPSKIQSVY
jgi:transcriptional/translational regulatory protein YebC/TACO1